MDDHPRRLVDDQERIVLVDDRYRDVLPGNRTFLNRWDLDTDYFARDDAVAGLLATAGDSDVSQRNQGSGLRPRKLTVCGNKEIEADIAVRLDGILSNFAQKLNLRGCVRR